MNARNALLSLLLLASPALALPPNDAVVTFNEIHYNPAGTGEAGEWVELHNQMAVDVDLSGWRLNGGIDYRFPVGTVIPGGAQMVIAKSPGGIAGSVGPFEGALSNSGEDIELLDNNGRVMDSLTYGDKGEWPIAPDGGGVTLAKAQPHTASALAGSWVASAQMGGTPGTANFPAQLPPTRSQVIARNAAWKFENSGAAPATDWKTLGFNDGGWASGPGGFYFGSPVVYQDPPPAIPGGIWTTLRWTGDSTSEVSSTKTYTHKIGLNRAGAYTPINGVTFDSPGSGVRSGTNWALSGADFAFTNNGNGAGANNLPAGSGSRQLCEEFFYGASLGAGTSRLELSGLTADQGYVMTLYATGFGGPGGRPMQITPSDSGRGFVVDENAAGSGDGIVVRYHYKAPASGTITFDFLPLAVNATWHHYAFSNEVSATTLPQEIEATASLAGFSSELGSNPFARHAVNVINGSGLVDGRHGVTPDGTMWLSNGTFAAPTDPLPAEITFDLGALVHLTSFHVWNYNEATDGLMTRGANNVQVLVAQDAGGPFTSAGSLTFIKASGTAGEPGQHFEFDQPNVRYVRFNILSSHGGDNQFAGLSEVKFYKQGVPSTTPVPYREKITSVFNTGIAADGSLLPPGQNDPHYFNVTNNVPAVVQAGHPAWMGMDGISQWTGLTPNGAENVAVGQFTWRTTFDLTGYASPEVRLLFSVDNNLDNVILNGAPKGINSGGFTSYLGPFNLTGLNAGENTVDLVWTNVGTDVNPGGLRVRWDATGQPIIASTELPANPVTTYFRKVFNYPGNPQSDYRLLLNYVADDGAVFYLNGQEIYRVNVTGAPTNATLADEDEPFPMFSGQFEVPADALTTGDNVLAVELHQASAGNADAFFTATLDLVEIPPPPIVEPAVSFNEIAPATAGTFFIELRNTTGAPLSLNGYSVVSSGGGSYSFGAATIPVGGLLALDQTALGFRPPDGDKLFLVAPAGGGVVDAVVIKNNPQARDASGRWLAPSASTPGATNTFTINSDVVINEIMYHHHATYLPTGTVDSPEEWIELTNRGAGPVVLTGWKIRGGVSYDFAAGTTIQPGGFLVVSNDPAALLAKFSGISVVGPFSGSLSNTDDLIRLEDASDNPADEVHYHHAGRWSGKADGDGSSLELRNPQMDNSVPEAWGASDETSRSTWQTFTYSGTAAPYPGSNDPTNYNEFVMGLLSQGEFLIDDITVKEVSVGNRECIQNGDFSSGTASFWRNLGTHGSHGRTQVVDDPSAPGNKVLRVVATGPTEHMHNHCETTLKNGATFVPIVSTNTYNISFRARWLSGSPRLHTKLYFNRLARQNLLPIPAQNGTPGAPNTQLVANGGPTFAELSQSPALPEAGTSVTLRVKAEDPNSVASVVIKWRKDGDPTFSTAPMTLTGDHYSGEIPGQLPGTVGQFYIEATDGLGAASFFPVEGPASRALVKWNDGIEPTTAGHGFRILMLGADSDFLHLNTNVMSNDAIPCTVIYRESEVFYNTTVRLKSSERGRLADVRVGFVIDFDPLHRFRGVHESMSLDRSGYGRGTTGNGYGLSDIVTWHFFNRAGGIPSMYNDIAYLIAPRSQHNGSAQLVMAEFNDAWLDSQFSDGAGSPVFKYELIYFPTTTVGGGPEGLKIPQPDDVRGIELESLNTTDKEAFRWNFLIGNARRNDDYSGMLELNQTYRLSGAPFNAAIGNAVDVDQWLRAAAALSLAGIGDNYISSAGAWHNLKLYARADGRVLYLPWDIDFQTQPANAALIINPDISRITSVSPANQRLFYQHLQDLMNTSFNTEYLTTWVNHYQTLNTSGGNWPEILTYVTDRSNFVLSQINGLYPPVEFAITTNGGNDFSSAGPNVTLTGTGWLDVRTIQIEASGLVLDVTWTSGNTWSVNVPIGPGANSITLLAYDYQGNIVAGDVITITGTGTVIPAAAGNLVISEIHYNPPAVIQTEINAGYSDKDDFEFIEVRNIGTQTVNLGGCRFAGGLDYNLPAATLAPGAYAVVARRSAAFALRHNGVTVLGEYYQPGANFLANDGEQIALIDSGGADIARLTYGENGGWPISADGLGKSLVLVAPRSNPDPDNALHWRASSTNHGNPGGGDALALPGNLAGDDDGDGLTNLVEHAVGPGKLPVAGMEIISGQRHLTLVIEREPLADVNWDAEKATTLGTWSAVATAYEVVARVTLPNGAERLTLRSVAPNLAAKEFLRTKLSAQP
jgi:hypothetical protein